MLESLCNRLSRHCSPRSTCSTTSPLSHLHLLPMPLPCSPPLQTSSARSFSRRSSPLSPKLCHALPLKLHNNSLSRSEEHTSELQSHSDLVCRLLLEKKKNI